jgi:hypothetical protein
MEQMRFGKGENNFVVGPFGQWYIDKGAKNNSPYTSFSTVDGVSTKYGNHKITLDLDALRQGIASGEVKGVEIIEHDEVLRLIEDSALHDYSKRRAMSFAKSDNEILIRGTFPSKYVKAESIEK